MEPIFIHAEPNQFIVHFEPQDSDNKMRWEGSVYEIIRYMDDSWAYLSNESSDVVGNKEDARCWFSFIYCWRGVWEGRVYFQDDEYWGEEIEIISLVWDHLEIHLQKKIALDNPDYKFFD